VVAIPRFHLCVIFQTNFQSWLKSKKLVLMFGMSQKFDNFYLVFIFWIYVTCFMILYYCFFFSFWFFMVCNFCFLRCFFFRDDCSLACLIFFEG
jgi:hypothetical protein